MNASIMLCAVLLTTTQVEPAANGVRDVPVKVKVIYGTSDKSQQADIEPWISRAMAEAGSPLAATHADWIGLTSDLQRIHTSTEGGIIVHGKVTQRNGKYDVTIDGCDGGPLEASVTLTPGQRRVVKLSDYPEPANIFIVLEAPVSENAAKRAEAAKANVKTFRLELNFSGQEDKPFYRLIGSVPKVDVDRGNSFHRIIQVNELEAKRIIDHLARDGFLDRAVELTSNIKIPPPTMPGYTMKVVTGEVILQEDLGWGLAMIHRLDDLRLALPDAGKKDLDFLLGRLAGLRKQWEAAR